jgi:hypothetical protein
MAADSDAARWVRRSGSPDLRYRAAIPALRFVPRRRNLAWVQFCRMVEIGEREARRGRLLLQEREETVNGPSFPTIFWTS